MPIPMYKPRCEHEGNAELIGLARCRECGQEHEFVGPRLTMHERMARYQAVYGLKPIGPHRPMADKLLGGKRADCDECDRQGFVARDDGRGWLTCRACEGTGRTWACSPEEVKATRRTILERFPDAEAVNVSGDYLGSNLIHDLGQGEVVGGSESDTEAVEG